MASAQQLKALLKAYAEGDQGHFLAIIEQVAAHEARAGHTKFSQELEQLLSLVKRRAQTLGEPKTVPIAQPKGELVGLLSVTYPKQRLSDMVLPATLRRRLVRIIQEHRQISRIRTYGLSPRRKILFVGPPGTGKTLSAAVLAGELSLPLFVVRLERMITKFMGETAAKLRLIFDNIATVRGVYFFDEFDSIGSQRGLRNDVGEIRRVLNSFLQFIEADDSQSLILAATNHPELLDHALFRRFDDVIEYQLPTQETATEVLTNRLASVRKTWKGWAKLARESGGMSYADIARACDDAIKLMVINQKEELSEADVLESLHERKAISRS
jgi:SpoVK/Ycf46/Vps4 family AAA+-type ATPase